MGPWDGVIAEKNEISISFHFYGHDSAI